jgi:anaerobic selenocysteine-containing dehydrogenase
MKRVGEKGEGELQRISWDEALDTIATKLKEVKAKYGPECVAALRGRGKGWVLDDNLILRLMYTFGSPNTAYDNICFHQRNFTYLYSTKANLSMTGDYTKANLIILWGVAPDLSGTACVTTAKLILDAVERGAKLVDIRPLMEPLTARADIWVPVRPGQDNALALAMINVMINENLYDADFVAKWCYGFNELKEHIQKYTPEWAEPITGVSADMIREVARLYGTIKPAALILGDAADQMINATNLIRSVIILQALSGNIDKPGGNLIGMPPAIRTRGVDKRFDRLTPEMVDKAISEWPKFDQEYRVNNCSTHLNLHSVITGKPYQIKAIMTFGTSLLAPNRDTKGVVEALNKVEFLVATDVVRTPLVDYADIVLPVAMGYELDHDYKIVGNRIRMRPKVIAPLGESRSLTQILLDLAVKMGYGADFWDGSMDKLMNWTLEPSGLTVEELRKHPDGITVGEAVPKEYEKYEATFKALPHGKIQLYNVTYAENGFDPLPGYREPPESVTGTPELLAEYPLSMSDLHCDSLNFHGHHRNVPWLREITPYPWLRINPATAKKYGINDGDWVIVTSPHGNIKVKAWYFEGLRLDTVMGQHGWWQECPELGLLRYSQLDGGANVNVLYNGELVDPMVACRAKQTLVNIRKA